MNTPPPKYSCDQFEFKFVDDNYSFTVTKNTDLLIEATQDGLVGHKYKGSVPSKMYNDHKIINNPDTLYKVIQDGFEKSNKNVDINYTVKDNYIHMIVSVNAIYLSDEFMITLTIIDKPQDEVINDLVEAIQAMEDDNSQLNDRVEALEAKIITLSQAHDEVQREFDKYLKDMFLYGQSTYLVEPRYIMKNGHDLFMRYTDHTERAAMYSYWKDINIEQKYDEYYKTLMNLSPMETLSFLIKIKAELKGLNNKIILSFQPVNPASRDTMFTCRAQKMEWYEDMRKAIWDKK